MIPRRSRRLHGGACGRRGGGWMKRREFLGGTMGGVGGIAPSQALRVRGRGAGAPRAGDDGIASIETPDPYTVKLTLSKPYAPMIALWGDTYIVPKHVLSTATDLNNNTFDTKPIGTGPFQFVERQAGDHITLGANTKYHGVGPYLDRLIFKYIPDLTVMFTRVQTGDLAVTGHQGHTGERSGKS